MTNRLLARLGLLLMAAAVAVPLAWGFASVLIRQPDLQWAAVNPFFRPSRMAAEFRAEYSFGFTLVLKNRGDAPTEPVRVLLDYPPRHFEIVERGPDDYTVTPVGEEGLAIDLGPLEPDERVRILIYELNDFQVEVLEGDERLYPLPYEIGVFDQSLRLPRWAALGGALLLAGLALHTVALRRTAARRSPTQPPAQAPYPPRPNQSPS